MMIRRSTGICKIKFRWMAGTFLLFCLCGSLTADAQSDQKVTHTVSGNTDNWSIEQPNVKEHITEYSQIRFQPGDRITIQAGGCVQTGGIGSTWKLYVHPTGPNADRLYHGLIWIPGVIGGPAATGVPPNPVRISAYIGPTQAVTVPSGTNIQQLYLRLGYEDDKYSDNGYSSHDNGTQDQCKNVGNAFVNLSIVHGTLIPPTTAALPFDLVWASEDDSGFPLNAEWGWQTTHPGAFPDPTQCTDGPFKGPCTSWVDVITQDTAEICDIEQFEPGHSNSPPLYGVAGHVNWAAGTYVGKIKWESHSTPGTDDDYNFDFYPAGGAGLTSTRDNLEVEFDSDETIDHFNTPWWNTLHHAVDNTSDTAVNNTLFTESDGSLGRYAIVTGLVGLEMCHAGDTELHPAWAVAIRVKDDDPSDEVWAMFIRRWGDEGFCSGDQHYITDLPNDTYTFRLPWRPGATGVTVGSATTFLAASSGASGPNVQSASKQGLLVSFTLPTPSFVAGICTNCNRINGELHLNWQAGQGPAPIPSTTPSVATKFPRPGPVAVGPIAAAGTSHATAVPVRTIVGLQLPGAEAEKGSPEEAVAALITKASSAQRSEYLATLPTKAVSVDAETLKPGGVAQISTLPKRNARARHRQYLSVADPAKTQKNQHTLAAVRKLAGQ